MNVKKVLGFAAVGALLIIAAPAQQAQAASPINPGIGTAAHVDTTNMTTEVRWHRRWHRRHWHPRRHWHHRRHWR